MERDHATKSTELRADLSDEQAMENVFASWNTNRDLGTKMHKCFEQFLNGESVTQEANFSVEMAQFHNALQELSDLTPVRTEMSIYANDAAGDAAVAGQIDLLMRDASRSPKNQRPCGPPGRGARFGERPSLRERLKNRMSR